MIQAVAREEAKCYTSHSGRPSRRLCTPPRPRGTGFANAFNSTQNGAHRLCFVFVRGVCALFVVLFVCRPMHVWAWKIKRHLQMWNSRFKSRQNETGMSCYMSSFASQLQRSLSSNGLLLVSWSPFWKSPFPKPPALKSKRRCNVATITSLFLIWAAINTFIQMRARSFAAELIGSSQPIYDRGSSPRSGVGSIKCIESNISLTVLLTCPRSSAKLNFD